MMLRGNKPKSTLFKNVQNLLTNSLNTIEIDIYLEVNLDFLL